MVGAGSIDGMVKELKDTERYLDAARTLAETAASEADRIDAERRLPPELAGAMADAGLFRLLVPRALGGAEMDLADFLGVVDAFAAVDASTAWCVNQNNVFGTNAARMPPATAREIWSDPRAVISNGPPVPSTRAVPVPGGYTVTGTWNFSSGMPHATWVAALSPLGGAQELDRPAVDYERGIVLLIPKDQVEAVDAWHVSGLRGTGSLSFSARDLFVPQERSYRVDAPAACGGALYRIPTVLLFAAGFATVALGNARAALDAAIAIARTKTPVMRTSELMHASTTQRQIGEAHAAWASARAFLEEAARALWEGASEADGPSQEERIGVRLAGTHGIRTGAQVVRAAYDIAGSDGIFAGNPVQRRLLDAQVITQQVQGRMTHYDTAGAFYLGLEPTTLF